MYSIEEKRIGYAVFDHRQIKRQRLVLTKDARKTMHEEDQWWICHGEYTEQKWDVIFPLMRKALPQKIQLGRNLRPNIIKEVSLTKFINLKQLCFGKNNILDLEDIAKIDAPLLQWLSFEQNYLTSVRPLRKAFFPNLRILNLKFNKLKEIHLSEFNTPKLAKICLELCSSEPKQSENISWVLKMQTTKLVILRCKNSHRISNSLIERQIAKKYPGIQYKKYMPDSSGQSESDH